MYSDLILTTPSPPHARAPSVSHDGTITHRENRGHFCGLFFCRLWVAGKRTHHQDAAILRLQLSDDPPALHKSRLTENRIPAESLSKTDVFEKVR